MTSNIIDIDMRKIDEKYDLITEISGPNIGKKEI